MATYNSGKAKDNYGGSVDISGDDISRALAGGGKEVDLGGGRYAVANQDGTLSVRTDSGFYGKLNDVTQAAPTVQTPVATVARSQAELEPSRTQLEYYSGPGAEEMLARKQQTQQPQATRSRAAYDLTEYLKAQKAAEVEAALAGLKGAYDRSLAAYQSAQDRLPQAYAQARNQAAAQSALEQRAFDERAAASGLSSGAAGQADLARSSVLQGALAGIGQQQANAEADLELQRAQLTAEYQSAIQQAKATGNAQLAQALYQELIRVQEMDRSDAQLATQQALQADQTAYTREQTARQEAQSQVNSYLAALGSSSDLDPGLVAQSGYTAGELSALEQYYAQQAAGAGTTAAKPTLTAQQAYTAYYKNGVRTQEVADALKYYYGIDITGGDGGAGTVRRTGAGGTGGGTGYNNGTLEPGQVTALQAALGVAVDGYFGPASQRAAQAVYSTSDPDEAWRAYQRTKAEQQKEDGALPYAELLVALPKLRGAGASAQEMNTLITEAVQAGIISTTLASQLRSAYIGTGR